LDEDTRNKLIEAYPNIAEISIQIDYLNQPYLDYHRAFFNQKEAEN
jgi:hypothetical protein